MGEQPEVIRKTTRFAEPPLPGTSPEYITALAHFHRAEIARMAGWRDRIDRTTNWAITGGGAMLSVSLATRSAHHGVLLFTMLLVLLFLLIESRRYRFFDVYRTRVRLIERNYFAPMFNPDRQGDEEWAKELSDSLYRPVFLTSMASAMSRRLRRTYFWIFLIILLAWVLKLSTPRLQDIGTGRDTITSADELVTAAAIGPVPGWLIVLLVCLFYLWLTAMLFVPGTKEAEIEHGEVRV